VQGVAVGGGEADRSGQAACVDWVSRAAAAVRVGSAAMARAGGRDPDHLGRRGAGAPGFPGGFGDQAQVGGVDAEQRRRPAAGA
jgi:hypothetical protein